MRFVAQVLSVVVLGLTIASPAFAARGALSKEQRTKLYAKQAACKKEASEQKFGAHLLKKRAFIKECMKK